MAGRSLRQRKTVDYNTMHKGLPQSNEMNAMAENIKQKDIVHELSAELEKLEMEEEQIRLELAVEHKKKQIDELKSAIASSPKVQLQPHQTIPQMPQMEPTTQTLGSDAALNEALALLKNLDFLNTAESESVITKPPDKGKLLTIPDFVHNPTGSATQYSELGKGLFLHAKAKLKPEDITTAQWISANTRILRKNIEQGLDQAGIKAYLKYTEKIGDYLQVSEISSVMLLDHAHRQLVFEENRRWDDIDGDMRYFYLEKSKSTTPAGPKQKRSFKSSTDHSGNIICGRFNAIQGCQLQYCKFSHVCSVQGCNMDHPRHAHIGSHNSAPARPYNGSADPPRFRPS